MDAILAVHLAYPDGCFQDRVEAAFRLNIEHDGPLRLISKKKEPIGFFSMGLERVTGFEPVTFTLGR
jgi:hypothetical protein